MIQLFVCLLILVPSFYQVTEGCGRVPATPAPPTTPRPTVTSINGSASRLECDYSEITKASCYNGGTCYILVLENTRVPNCICTKEYTGMKCEELDIENIHPSTERDHITTAKIAGITAGVVAFVVLVMAIISIVIYMYKKNHAAISKTSNNVLLQEHNTQSNGQEFKCHDKDDTESDTLCRQATQCM